MPALFLPAVGVALLTVVPLLGLTAAEAVGDAGPAASYSFDSLASAGEDASGHGHAAQVVKAQAVAGYEGGGLELAGDGGLQIPGDGDLKVTSAFAVELRVKFADVSDNANLVAKDGAYLLRLDPPNEGGQISFFVNAGGTLEPRVRGPKAVAGRWYHLIATWDGMTASLWVDGQEYTAQRRGSVSDTGSPILVGLPYKWGPVGLKGTLDGLRLYTRALTDSDILLDQYGLREFPALAQTSEARFEFAASAQGWEALQSDEARIVEGQLVSQTHGGSAILLNRRLNLPVSGLRYVAVRMATDQGTVGKLVAVTDSGLKSVRFAPVADGNLHSYVFDLGASSQGRGNLRALGILPAEVATSVQLDFVRLSATADAPPELAVTDFIPAEVIPRAGRPNKILATVRNLGGAATDITLRLDGPEGLQVLSGATQTVSLAHAERREVSWSVQAAAPVSGQLRLSAGAPQMAPLTATTPITFAAAVEPTKADYVPAPAPPQTEYLVGAHYCPLWKQGARGGGWQEIVPFPEREPALGWYDEENPEVTDWEVKWALDHGINYFVYCWYRRNQGQGVQTMLSHAIHDGLFHSRYGSQFKFTIMWENQSKGQAGVASEDDFLNTLLPYWIENYFKNPSYLKIDNKPLLFIYRPEFLINDLGSVEAVKQALDKAREVCKRAGFAGLTILGEYRGTQPAPLELMAAEGLDYSFAYCWPVGGEPSQQESIDAQERYWKDRQKMGIIPDLVTVSMGWDSRPWHPSSSIWRLTPDNFQVACERAKAFMATVPPDQLGHRLVLLDNWNEFGEGHYIAPHRQYGFGYLDAARNAFCTSPKTHLDLIPQDLGLGPYDAGFRRYELADAECRRVLTPPADMDPAVIGWWTFDEPEGSTIADDWSGHARGGLIENAALVPGRFGRALSCRGGSVAIPRGAMTEDLDEMTVEAWIRCDAPGQSDKWFVNNVFNGGDSGFRFGLSGGKLCFAIPSAPWSHHLAAGDPLPVGTWVHAAGTYDGQTIRLYVNGKECGSMPRSGPVMGNQSTLCLGNYDRNHTAFFTGLLDDVRIYRRALSAEEVAQRAAR
ncbi:MAG: LamG-like jellyroll fold domain-containing protein [Armatimonadia bacterium]